MASSLSPPPPWADLLPDVLGKILVRYLCSADIARFRAVCRAWHSAAARELEDEQQQEMPWIVIPIGSFCTIGDTGAFYKRIPGLPRNVTCLGATDGWFALDCTDDVFRRTNIWDTYTYRDGKFLEARSDVKYEHSYLLHNPFYGKRYLAKDKFKTWLFPPKLVV